MRKITINLAAVAAFCIVVASPALVSSSCATPKTEQEDTTIIREDSGITALKYSSPEVPASIEFCGKTIDLSRFDRHERMDRELLAFTYMLKLRKAKQLLIESSMSVKEICYELNYTSTEHFFSVFKKRTNFTPTEYRNFGRGGKEKENENE